MRSHSKTLLIVSFLLISLSTWAQETDHHESALLCRIGKLDSPSPPRYGQDTGDSDGTRDI
jgi:hypothetical protein